MAAALNSNSTLHDLSLSGESSDWALPSVRTCLPRNSYGTQSREKCVSHGLCCRMEHWQRRRNGDGECAVS